jgi:hypothetical protein
MDYRKQKTMYGSAAARADARTLPTAFTGLWDHSYSMTTFVPRWPVPEMCSMR